jgi:hypothetical protein
MNSSNVIEADATLEALLTTAAVTTRGSAQRRPLSAARAGPSPSPSPLLSQCATVLGGVAASKRLLRDVPTTRDRQQPGHTRVEIRPTSALSLASAAGGARRRGRVMTPVRGMRDAHERIGAIEILPGDGIPLSRQAVVRLIRENRGMSLNAMSPSPSPHPLTATAADASPANSVPFGADAYGPLHTSTYGCASEVQPAVMGETARTDWIFPSASTTVGDVHRAAEKFAEERARFVTWAKRLEEERAGNAEAAAGGTRFDSVWIETALAKLRLAGPPNTTDGAGVFRSLGAYYLLGRAVDTLVPATARAVLQTLIGELHQAAAFGLTLTKEGVPATTAAVDDLAPATRPDFSGAVQPSLTPEKAVARWAHQWGHRRLAGESLHLERLRRAAEANEHARQQHVRRAEYDRDVDVLERRRQFEATAKLRMVLKAWRGFVATQQRKRRVAKGVINSLADRASRELSRTVLYALRSNVATQREYRRRQRQFDDAAAHKLREAKLLEQIANSHTHLTRAITEASEAADSASEAHWREICQIRAEHEAQDKENERVRGQNMKLTAANEELTQKNRRWALLTNQALLETTSAVERRTNHPRRHPEVELLYVVSHAKGEAPVQASSYQTLFDVLDGNAASQRLLLLFANYCVRACGQTVAAVQKGRSIDNFEKDMADGVAAACALAVLYPTLLPKEEIVDCTVVARCERVCAILETVGLVDLVSPTDLMLGAAVRLMTLFTTLLRLYALTTRFGTADHDTARLESKELIVPGLRRRRGSLRSLGQSSGRSRGRPASSMGGESSSALPRHAMQRFSDYDTVVWVFAGEEVVEPQGSDDQLNRSTSTTARSPLLSPKAGALSNHGTPTRGTPTLTPALTPTAAALAATPKMTIVSVAQVNLVRTINTDIEDMESKFAQAVERQRAWSYIAELTQRDLTQKLLATRNALTGEILDEKGRRHMDWFLEADEDRLWRLVQLNPGNAKNEVDRVQMVLNANYWNLRNIYQAYAAADSGQRLSQDGFWQLTKDTQIVKGLGKHVLDDALRFAVEDTDVVLATPSTAALKVAKPGKGAEANDLLIAFVPTAAEKLRRKLASPMVNFQLSPQVFLVMICYIAHFKYRFVVDNDAAAAPGTEAPADPAETTTEPGLTSGSTTPQAKTLNAVANGAELLSLHRCVRKLLVEDLVGVARSSTVDLLRLNARHPNVQRAQKKYVRSVQRAFKSYSSGGAAAEPERALKDRDVTRAMTSDDALRFCRDARLLDNRFAQQDALDLASSLSTDDERLMAICENARAKAMTSPGAGFSTDMNISLSETAASRSVQGAPKLLGTDTLGPRLPFEVECGQPEDRRQFGMAVDDFFEFLTGVAMIKIGHPLVHPSNTVANFYRDVLAHSFKELHL